MCQNALYGYRYSYDSFDPVVILTDGDISSHEADVSKPTENKKKKSVVSHNCIHSVEYQSHNRKLVSKNGSLFLQIPKLLIGQRLDGRCVHDALTIVEGLGNGVFGHGRFSCRRVCGHQDGLFLVNVPHRLRLKGIERKGIFFRWLVG